jgi:hypothetical protein
MSAKYLTAAVIIIVSAVAAQAQNAPRAELYTGFPVALKGAQLFGANASLDVNATNWFGVRTDFNVHVGEVYADKSLSTFLAGPVFSHRSGRFTHFAHVLFGGAWSGCGDFGYGCQPTTVLANAFGGGVQRKTGGIGIRLVAEAVTTRFGGEVRTFPRFSAGVSFGF